MYNNILLLVLLIALFSTLSVDDNTKFYIIVPTILIATTNVSLASFLPTILIKLHILYTSSRDSHATGSSKGIGQKSSIDIAMSETESNITP